MVLRDPHFLYFVGRDLVQTLAAFAGGSRHSACPACQCILEVPLPRASDAVLFEKLLTRAIGVAAAELVAPEGVRWEWAAGCAAVLGLCIGFLLGIFYERRRAHIVSRSEASPEKMVLHETYVPRSDESFGSRCGVERTSPTGANRHGRGVIVTPGN